MADNRIRILIADNNPDLCQTLLEFFEQQSDMTVVAVATDGEATMEALENIPVDVVILDVAMPRLDGMAVLERLRELELPVKPRVIVLSALGNENIMHRLTSLGADYYIVKPIDLAVLAQRIRQFGRLPDDKPTASEVRPPAAAPSAAVKNTEWLDLRISELLHKIGVPPHMKGYLYLREAVRMVLDDDRLLAGGLTKRLYPMVAEKYQSSAGGVEAAIRNVLTAWWERGDRQFQDIKGNGFSGPKWNKIPTNSAMIAELADIIRFETAERNSRIS
ncbi:MAG TPA: sporulation transcription factor Spo0A [Firmicutes bacterium]|nr:sporulation transcription factor Spo0A [Bacillota bacterium]